MRKLFYLVIFFSILATGSTAFTGKIKPRYNYECATQCVITLFFLDQCDCYGLLLEGEEIEECLNNAIDKYYICIKKCIIKK